MSPPGISLNLPWASLGGLKHSPLGVQPLFVDHSGTLDVQFQLKRGFSLSEVDPNLLKYI